MGLWTRVLACSAALSVIVLVTVPGSRSFASDVAARIVHLRPAGSGGPIPFILDLHKHKHKRPHAAPAKAPSSTQTIRPHAGQKAAAVPVRPPALPSR